MGNPAGTVYNEMDQAGWLVIPLWFNICTSGVAMKLLRQAAVILGICFAGEWLHQLFKLPIPGNVIGMLLLLTGLCSGVIKLAMIEEFSNFLLDHLAFFFIPAGVGVLACLGVLRGKWLAFVTICIVTTVLIIVVTGHSIQWVKRGGKR